MINRRKLEDASVQLYNHILRTHWTGDAVCGSDPGIRFNSRVGRFIKGYLNFLPWGDNMAYAQAQKYWITDNWMMHDLGLVDQEQCRQVAIAASERLSRVQHSAGYWEHPNPEWKGRIQTVEGNYGAIGMLETYARTRDESLLEGAIKWYDYAVEHIGFQDDNGALAINYFGNVHNGMVPNNAASAIRVFAQTAKAAQDERFLEYCPGLVKFLIESQVDTGMLPYKLAHPDDHEIKEWIYFLCYNYNAFQFLNIMDYYKLTQDELVLPVLEGLARFISTGISEYGAAWYDANNQYPEVLYYTPVAAAALSSATTMDLGNYRDLADLSYSYTLSCQKPDGNMTHYSRKNYGFLQDRRSYPRYLSMILNHLLMEVRRLRDTEEAVTDFSAP